jgi:hypothetical protein
MMGHGKERRSSAPWRGAKRIARAGAALLFLALLTPVATGAKATPFAPAGWGQQSGGLVTQARDCGGDCPVEIDIGPAYPSRHGPDLIAREIERIGPPPPPPGGACAELSYPWRPQPRRGDPLEREGCGIRCWYWRLRNGYCGPGCEYYYYRLNHFERRVGGGPRFGPHCPS